MPRRRTTFRTSSEVTRSIARTARNRNTKLAGLLAAAILTLCAQTPPPHPPLSTIVQEHIDALSAMHVHQAHSVETIGTLRGLDATGTFHEWQSGQSERRDEQIGLRSQHILHVGDKMWISDSGGRMYELTGNDAHRQVTENFVDAAVFENGEARLRFVDRETLHDGRVVYRMNVIPLVGETYSIAIDAKTWLIDEVAYREFGKDATATFYDYRVVNGVLLPFTRIDSRGDPQFDVISNVTKVLVNQPIDPSVFAPLEPVTIDATAPVTIPLELRQGFAFATVTIDGKPFRFLIDSGSQGDAIDPSVATALGLHPEGTFEMTGAASVPDQGVVQLTNLKIGGLSLPPNPAAVIDVANATHFDVPIDGILGYPFFECAEVRIDAAHSTMTVAKPGALPQDGARLSVDTDRELPEIEGEIDRIPARLVVDTGDTNELLVYKDFMDAHPGVVDYAGARLVENHALGGSMRAYGAVVGELDLGSEKLYNRYSNVIFATSGSFADPDIDGNVGFGTLRAYVVTFDLAHQVMYLRRTSMFDDGRFRPQTPEQMLPGGHS